MKRILTSLFLLFVFTIAWLKPSIPYIQYELNKDYIQRFLCEKKDVTENSCKGKCQLREQIKRINENEDKKDFPMLPLINSDDYPVFDIFLQSEEQIKANIISVRCSVLAFYDFRFTVSVFHPPN